MTNIEVLWVTWVFKATQTAGHGNWCAVEISHYLKYFRTEISINLKTQIVQSEEVDLLC